MPVSVPPRKILALFEIYLITLCSLTAAFAILALAYYVFPASFLDRLLYLFPYGAPLILICMGIVSLIPLSEFFYLRKGGINPAIAKDIETARRRGREKKELGMLLGIAGLTAMMGLNPWDILFSSLQSTLNTPAAALLMIAILAMLAMLYMRLLREYTQKEAK